MAVAEFEELFHVGASLQQEIGSRMHVGSVHDQLLEELDVGFIDSFRIRQDHGHVHWNGDLYFGERGQ